MTTTIICRMLLKFPNLGSRKRWLTRVNCIVLALLLGSPVMGIADVLSIPGDETSDTNIVLPTRGMTMDEVSEQFGTPGEVVDPVGMPPITRWIYDNFTVNFEYEHVIIAVKNRRKKP